MKILVTGAQGFIGKNLIAELRNRKYTEIFEYGKHSSAEALDEYCRKADFVFHLAGVNRPKDPSEFMDGNYGLTASLLEALRKHGNDCPILISSSTQAELSNPYGTSKKACEELLLSHAEQTGAKTVIYRLPNVFGKWCKPNYNSAVATFCHNIARDLPITVNDPGVILNLVYIDDVVEEFINAMNGKENCTGRFCEVPVSYKFSLEHIVNMIYSFKKTREEWTLPNVADSFTRKLYSTYLTFLPKDRFSYDLKMNVDHRGSFTEFLKTPDRGQVSVNISKPGITKGNHWHHTKCEKFLVVSGRGVIRFRSIDSIKVTEYYVSGDKLQVVDIPSGFAHNIENLGDTDMVTIMWVNEFFDPEKPDTHYLEV